MVAAVSGFLIEGSSGKYAILPQGLGASMIWDVRVGKVRSQEFADCSYPLLLLTNPAWALWSDVLRRTSRSD